MNQLDLDYQNLLKDILENGIEKNTRNGKVLSVFGRSIRYNFKDGKFPLLTTKKMYFKGIVTELLWFLRGDTNIKYLVDNDCHIWDGDAYKNYVNKIKLQNNWEVTLRVMDINTIGQQELLSKEEFTNKIKTDDEFAKKWGELGPIYGQMWRNWDADTGERIDQIANLISELKTNPDSRRLMVSAWNPTYIPHCVLPPCHYGFQFYTRELSLSERCELGYKYIVPFEWDMIMGNNHNDEDICNDYYIPTRAISLMYNARSQDVPLGTPFNIASYALLLEIIAKMVNMVPDELITNMGDCHIYLNQIDGVKEQLTREPYELPKLVISNQVNFNEGVDEFLNSCSISDFQIEGYQSHPTIKIPLSN